MRARLGLEQMHDDVAGVDQHPVGTAGALHLHALQSGAVQFLRQMFGHRRDLPVGKACRDHHAIAERRLAL